MKTRTIRLRNSFIGVGLAALGLCFLSCVLFVRVCAAPTSSMRPTLVQGQRVVVETFSYLVGKPARGDVIAFRSDSVPDLPPHGINFKRVVGLPGEHIGIEQGQLYVNGKVVAMSNRLGIMTYDWPPGGRVGSFTDLTVPAGQYFVLGDNSTDSFDSRYWGCVAEAAILGRVWTHDR